MSKKRFLKSTCDFFVLTVKMSVTSGGAQQLSCHFSHKKLELVGSGSKINNAGSGSCKKFRIRQDPDPQHCLSGALPTFFYQFSPKVSDAILFHGAQVLKKDPNPNSSQKIEI